MGHLLLGKRLPRNRTWQQVVAILDGGASVRGIAAATLSAATAGFIEGKSDPGFNHALWLLARIPLAAKNADLQAGLSELGVRVSATPTLLEITSAVSRAIDDVMRDSGRRSDFGVMAKNAVIEAIVSLGADREASLFGVSTQDTQRALKSFATEKQFGRLGRVFFSSLVDRYLMNIVSRELPVHVGGQNRFKSPAEHSEFRKALRLHCDQATVIVETYSGGWFSKAAFESGISRGDAGRYGAYALTKLSAELTLRAGTDG